MFRVETVTKTLVTGDYALGGGDGSLYTVNDGAAIVLMEKKGSMSEVHHNVSTADCRRTRACLKRLSQSRYPYLVFSWAAKNPVSPYLVDAEKSQDRILRAMHLKGLRLLWMPATTTRQRVRVAEWLLRIMWTHVWETMNEGTGGHPDAPKVR